MQIVNCYYYHSSSSFLFTNNFFFVVARTEKKKPTIGNLSMLSHVSRRTPLHQPQPLLAEQARQPGITVHEFGHVSTFETHVNGSDDVSSHVPALMMPGHHVHPSRLLHASQPDKLLQSSSSTTHCDELRVSENVHDLSHESKPVEQNALLNPKNKVLRYNNMKNKNIFYILLPIGFRAFETLKNTA